MAETVNFVTTNQYKFELTQKYFEKHSSDRFTLVQYDLETPEIQDESEEMIASHSALWVSQQLGQMAIASDVGFHINTLNGFPGPFVKYANKWLRPNDILNMMRSHTNRTAFFVDVLALATPEGECKTFVTRTMGKIVDAEQIANVDWTMDALFIPDGHSGTLHSMDDDERDSVWSNDAWDQLIALLDKAKNN